MSDNIENRKPDSNDPELKTSQSQESDVRNFHEDEEISDSEILDVALSSSIARDKSDTENDYCYMLTARIINYQVLHDLAVSSPIFTSNRPFPRLEYIQNQYSMLTSDPYASSKLVQSLLANIQPKISHFVNKTISDCQNSDLVNQVINDVLRFCDIQFQYALDIEKKLKEKQEKITYLELKGRLRS